MLTNQSKFVVYSLGIFFCYFYYGMVQETITRGRYGDQRNEDGTIGERFVCALALVWVQCFCNWIFAKIMLITRPQSEDTTNKGYYATCSLTYLLAMVSSNMVLRWVPYPTQVVAKSAKPIPVMVLGVLIGRKTYSWIRYFCVFLIVTGVVIFMFKENKNVKVNEDMIGLGELLLLMSLAMDGLTGAVQDRIRASSAPSGQQMMLSMNWWGTMMLGFALIATGEGTEFIRFSIKHPSLLLHLSTLAVAGGIGQLFIFLMISGYGPLACSVVTTTRKFFTVLFSVIVYGNVLCGYQWFGAILVFTGLFADMFFGKKTNISSKKVIISRGDEENKKLLS